MTQKILEKAVRRNILHDLLVEFLRPQAAYFRKSYKNLNRYFWSQHMAEVRSDLNIEADEWRVLTDYKIVPTVSSIQPIIYKGGRGFEKVGRTPFDCLPEVLHRAFRDPGVKLLGKRAPMQPDTDRRSFVMTFRSTTGPVAWIKNMEYFASGSSMADRCTGNAYIWQEIVDDGTEFAADTYKVLLQCQTIEAFHSLVPEAVGDFSEKADGTTLIDQPDHLVRTRMRLQRSYWKEQ